MTCDEFEMNAHHGYFRELTWTINAKDGGMKIELSVFDENIQDTVKYNFAYLSETIKEKLTDRAVDLWDLGEITDTEKAVFLTILEKVM